MLYFLVTLQKLNTQRYFKQMKTAEQAASDCGNAMCEKYGMTIDHSIPCEDAFLMGVEFGRKDEGKNDVEPINNK